MEKSKFISIIALSTLTLGAVGIAVAPSTISRLSTRMVQADEESNRIVIDKTASKVGSTITVKTDKKNSVNFNYSRFSVKNGYEDYDNCISFANVDYNGVGGYITNATPLYGVKSIKIYSYTPEDPYSNELATGKFNLYYGYEPLKIKESNTARIIFRNGSYEFPSDFEPSYIAIECRESSTFYASRVEITYKCEEVEGTIETINGPAEKYNYVGKEFTTTSGTKIPYNIVEEAPWIDVDNSEMRQRKKQARYDSSAKEWTTKGEEYFDFYPTNQPYFTQSNVRKIVTMTFKFNPTYTNMGLGGADLYFGVNGGLDDVLDCVTYSFYALKGTQVFERGLENAISVYNADTGENLFGKSIINKRITISFDASSVEEIKNVFVGTTQPYVTFGFEKITFQSSICGCSKIVPVEYSTGSEFGEKCQKCGYVLNKIAEGVELSEQFQGYISYKENIKFDDRDNCTKISMGRNSGLSGTGMPYSYRLNWKNIITNARNCGYKCIKLNFYIKTVSSIAIRFGWGVDGVEAGAQYDFSTGTIKSLVGYDYIKTSSQILGENGSATTIATNKWLMLVVDITDSMYIGVKDFWMMGAYYTDGNENSSNYPLETYFSSIRCEK